MTPDCDPPAGLKVMAGLKYGSRIPDPPRRNRNTGHEDLYRVMRMDNHGLDIPKTIGDNIALIALLIVWPALILHTTSRVSWQGMEPHQAVSYALAVIAIPVFIAAIPAAAVLFGWFTKRKTASLLFGALLFPCIYCISFFFLSRGNMVFIRVPETALYIGGLSAISGLAGYCAAHRTGWHLAAAIVLVGIWVVGFLSGIN